MNRAPPLDPGQQVAARDVIILPPLRSRGMGDSIAAGVSARADASGWVLLPADMPRVRASTLQQVGRALQTHAVPSMVPADARAPAVSRRPLRGEGAVRAIQAEARLQNRVLATLRQHQNFARRQPSRSRK